jgi:hypothetical protein
VHFAHFFALSLTGGNPMKSLPRSNADVVVNQKPERVEDRPNLVYLKGTDALALALCIDRIRNKSFEPLWTVPDIGPKGLVGMYVHTKHPLLAEMTQQ